MKKMKNWKHNTKDRKQYGKRNNVKRETPFMVLDERCLKWD